MTCSQCELPTKVCSAIFHWRRAIERFQSGDTAAAQEDAAEAEEWYRLYSDALGEEAPKNED